MTSIFKRTAWRTSYAKWLKSALGSACLSLVLEKEHLILTVNKSSLVAVMWFLKNHPNCLYKCLRDVTWTDFDIEEDRLEVSYHLLSAKYFDRITLKVNLSPEEDPYSYSVRSVFPTANWWGFLYKFSR